jgi:hypothetical protein
LRLASDVLRRDTSRLDISYIGPKTHHGVRDYILDLVRLLLRRSPEVQTPTASGAKLRYQEHDRISIPEDVPALGIAEGDEGVIRGLHLDNETVLALVAIAYSTGQPRGEITMEIKPLRKVHSYTTAPQ